MYCPGALSKYVIMVSSVPAFVPGWHTCMSNLADRNQMSLQLTENTKSVYSRSIACYVPLVAKSCTNRRSFLPMDASLPELPSPCLACCDRIGCKSGYLCPFVCALFKHRTLLFACLVLALAGDYCYNLLGSTQVLQGFPAGCPAYFPNSAVDFSA